MTIYHVYAANLDDEDGVYTIEEQDYESLAWAQLCFDAFVDKYRNVDSLVSVTLECPDADWNHQYEVTTVWYNRWANQFYYDDCVETIRIWEPTKKVYVRLTIPEIELINSSVPFNIET